MNKKSRKEVFLKSLKYLLGWPISAVALVFLTNLIFSNFNEVFPYLITPNLFLLIPSFFFFLIFFFLRALTWQKLLIFNGYNIPFKETSYLWTMAEFRRFVPGFIWSYLGKTVSFSKKGVDKETIASMILSEISLIATGAFIISLFSIPFVFQYLTLVKNSIFSFLIILLALILTTLYIFNKKIIRKVNLPKPFNYIFLVLPRFNPYENFILVFISSASFFAFSFASYLAVSSIVYLPVDKSLYLTGFFALSFLVSFLSVIAPMGLGVREGFITYGLAKLIPLEIAGLSSIFARIVLIISEVLFVLIVAGLRNIKNKFFLKAENFLERNLREAILCILIFGYIFYFTSVSFLRYDNFFTGRFDLGNMDQTVWNTINGRIFQFTNPDGTNIISRLSFHSDFILILISPLYLIWSHPKMLLVLQSIVLAFGALFIFLISKEVLKNKNLSLIFSVAYLFNPHIQHANLYDFHPVTISTTLLLGAFYLMVKKRLIPFLSFLFLAVLSKENVWPIAGIFGTYLFIKGKRKWIGGLLALISFLIFYLLVARIIPAVKGSEHFALSYYSELGDSPSSIIGNFIFSPIKTVSLILQGNPFYYLYTLTLNLGFLPFLSPFILFALPDFFINLLSANSQLREIYYHYNSTIVPFLFISSIYSVRFIMKKFQKIPTRIFGLYLILFAVYSSYLLGPLPFSKKANIAVFTNQLTERDEIENVLEKIPRQASVAATNNLGSHLSQRQKIFTIPIGVGEADYVVFLLNDPFAQPSLEAQKELAEKLKQDTRFEILYEKKDYIAFKRKL